MNRRPEAQKRTSPEMKSPLRILHLEDDLRDAELVEGTLEADGITVTVPV